MTNKKESNKIKINSKEMEELINQSHLGDEVINFKELVTMPRLRISLVHVLAHYIQNNPKDPLTTDQLDEILVLHQFLETI